MGSYFKKWKIRYLAFHRQYGLWFLLKVLKKYKVFKNFWGTKPIQRWDNAPSHVSSKALEFYEKNKIEIIELQAKSSNLNPIENIWSLLKEN